MYLEFFILIFDYYKTLTKRVLFFEWAIPLIIAVLLFWFAPQIDFTLFNFFKESALNILGVLLGFSIAIITILVTGNGPTLDAIKVYETGLTINQKQIKLFDLLLINFTYSVIMEIFIILSCLLLPLFSKVIVFSSVAKEVFYAFLIFFVTHVFLLTLRNISEFYLIISSNRRKA